MNLQTDNMKGFKYGRLFGYVLTAMSFLSCNQVAEEGVPLSLASQRAGYLSDVHYSLAFDLTRESGTVVLSDTVCFRAS